MEPAVAAVWSWPTSSAAGGLSTASCESRASRAVTRYLCQQAVGERRPSLALVLFEKSVLQPDIISGTSSSVAS